MLGAEERREAEGLGVGLESTWTGPGSQHIRRTGGARYEGPHRLPEMGLYSGRSGETLEVREGESDMPPQGQGGDQAGSPVENSLMPLGATLLGGSGRGTADKQSPQSP